MTTTRTKKARATKVDNPERVRTAGEKAIRVHCVRANAAIDAAAAAVRARDDDLSAWQGPRSEGKFSYTELADITGLSRSRVNQIITATRRRNGS